MQKQHFMDAILSPTELGKIAVLVGGRSREREVSFMSGTAVYNSLVAQGCDAMLLDWQPPRVLEQLQHGGFQRAFIAMHGLDGEDGCVQGVLEALAIPYTGSGITGSAVAFNKILSKHLFKAHNLPTLPFHVYDPALAQLDLALFYNQCVTDFGLPLCVKPNLEGSSLGVTKVTTELEFVPAIQRASQYNCQLIVEPWIEGGEYTVGILHEQVLPIIKIEAAEFYDYDAKYFREDTRYLIPSGLESSIEQRVQQLGMQAFRAVGAQEWGRVDFVADRAGNFWILEVNTIPGFTNHSLVPQAAQALGISFAEFVMIITADARLKQRNFANVLSLVGAI